MSKPPPVIDLMSSSEDDDDVEVTVYRPTSAEAERSAADAATSSLTSARSSQKKRSSPSSSSSSSTRSRPKRKMASSATPRRAPLQAGIVLEEDITADPTRPDTSTAASSSSGDEAADAIPASCQSYVKAQLDRVRSSLPALLYHDPEFEPVPSSIVGANSFSPILDDEAAVPKSKVEKCRCSPAQPAKLAYSTREGPNMHKPYYTCARKQCNHFKWAFQSHTMRWHRFGPHSGHALVGPAGFRAEDLVQGKVGDCWFLSALAVVAERPDLIARLFGTMAGMNEHGIVEVRLFVDGFCTNIIMDNFLPCIVDPAHDELGRAIQASIGGGGHAHHDWGAAAGTAVGGVAPSNITSAGALSSSQDPHALSDSTLKVIRQTHEYLEQDRFKKNGPLPPGQRTPYSRDVARRLNRTVETEDLAYSKAKGDQLWVPILEKAYAKVHGCYKAISGGHIAEAFLDLAGAPTIVYDFDAPDFNGRSLWSDLMSFRRRHLPMGCGTSSSAAGIVGMHAYSILDVREVRNVDLEFFRDSLVKGTMGNVSGFTEFDGTVRLLRIRNPHGRGEWKGDFSDGSEMWEKLLANRGSLSSVGSPCLERTMKNDGTFWIDYDHFLMGFSNVDVVLAFEGNHAKSFASNFSHKKSNHRCARAFKVSLLDEQPGMPSNDQVELYVMGIQKNKRGSKHGRSDRKKSYKVCDLGILVGKHRDGGRGAFETAEEDNDDTDFARVDGHMFGFTRNGHYRLKLDRKTCKSLVVMPLSFGHPAATDKELSFVLRYVADAPVMIRELQSVPRMDTTLKKLFFASSSTTLNANIMGTSSRRSIQGSKKIVLDDAEGRKKYGESLFRVFQVDYLGNGGGVVFVYLAVNDSLLKRKGVKNFSLSLSVEASCRGMMCRTAEGFQQHETVAKGKKFEAAWRRFTCSFTEETSSRLLMVLVQCGVSTEMGHVKCEKMATRYGDSSSKDNTMASFLGVATSDLAGDDYEHRGIFNPVAFNDSDIFQHDHVSTSSPVIINLNAAQYEQADAELEKALVVSRQEADLQRAIEGSANASHDANHAQPSGFDHDMKMAIAASIAIGDSASASGGGGSGGGRGDNTGSK